MKKLNIMHVDMDAFFAAVEVRNNPELKDKPVIIGGNNLNKRGVVATASYEARKYGVHSAMPIVRAKKLCPQGIFISGNKKRYEEESRKIFEILSSYTPLIEKISIDEAFLDLRGCHHLFGDSKDIGKKIKKEINNKTGLNASIGIAPNKFLAKLASDLDKPDGFVIIKKNEIKEKLNPLPVSNIWGVGEKTEKKLKKKGINTIGDLRKVPQNELENIFGSFGRKLYEMARGIDERKIVVDSETKSISKETTFRKSLLKKEIIFSALLILCEKVSRRLRKNKFSGNIVFLKIRYDNFKTYTRRKTLDYSFNDTESIYECCKDLLIQENLLSKPVRLLGVGVSALVKKNNRQLNLFKNNKNKNKLVETIDYIKDRYGEDSIFRARNLLYKNKDRL
ncbi:MAG: DNA polymerase IV [Bacillota bacterium]